ncbi:MAG: hypothetical protein CBD58_02490 [bacterium TMED198]|nr:MAG: hypothetical protein CBD58_02490 [bacterium TMED198]|tara:strand:- start:26 stop:706 length:681 start_codon:yes stop_codon:yes gene_type:complete
MIFFNYIRLIAGGLVFVFFSIPMFVLSFVKKDWIYPLSSIVGRTVLKVLGVRLCVEGSFPSGGPYIIMFNHSSFIDAFIFPAIVEGKYTGVTAKENFHIPVFSQILRRYNIIPIDRKNIKTAIRSLKKAEKYLNEGFHLGLLPEGSRSKNGSLRPFKKGGFHLAVHSQKSILPIGINGAFEYKAKLSYKLRPGKVVVKIGNPIPIKKDETIEGLLGKTYEAIQKLR